MDKEYTISGWQARLDRCPHCSRKLSIISNSRNSVDGAVGALINDLMFHIKHICKSTDKDIKKSIKFDVRVERKSKSVYNSTIIDYVWETNNKVIV